MEPRTVSRKTVGLIVGTAVRIIGRTVRVRKGTADLPAVAHVVVRTDLNGCALCGDILTAVFLFRPVQANP